MNETVRFLFPIFLLATVCCGGERPDAAIPAPPVERPAEAPRPRIVALGDSLTAGLGLPPEEAYPAVLEARIRQRGFPFEVVNAGVSGDTSAGGLRRIDWALEGDVRILILALGANDGLRGLPVDEMDRNLQAIIDRAKARDIEVLLAGMEAPPNYGERYTREYREAFRKLADRNDLEFVPFLLAGVAGVPDLNQRDGIHPTSRGARMIAETLLPALEKILPAAETRR
jgi:acyl-CoA thioesterase-1